MHRGRGLAFVDRQVRAPAELVDCLLAVLGARLLNALAETAHAAGFGRLSLSVAAENPARRLYERLGYREISREGDAVRMLLNRPPAP